MVTQLSVVNDCLATMGEAPLSSLAEDHQYAVAITTKLAAESERIQSKGWWFNTESLRLTPDAVDGRIKLPADAGASLTFASRPNLAQRGRGVYDLENGTDVFPAGTVLKSRMIRVIPFEDLPTSAASYIAAMVVLWFQNNYDGDSTKTRNLAAMLPMLQADMNAEHIRNRAVNLLDASARLSRIRNVVRQMNRY